jgi:hypothetical protein
VVEAQWIEFGTFALGVLMVALYGLTVSGHFPAEVRGERLRGPAGALVLWGTVTAAVAAAGALLSKAWWDLPWYLSVIGAGAALLFTPLLLRPLPDGFVNGRSGLLAFSLAALAIAALLWA